jgi:hypothetical protein
MSIALVILSLVAGSLAQEIKTDYDRKADFSHYKTFSFEKSTRKTHYGSIASQLLLAAS